MNQNNQIGRYLKQIVFKLVIIFVLMFLSISSLTFPTGAYFNGKNQVETLLIVTHEYDHKQTFNDDPLYDHKQDTEESEVLDESEKEVEEKEQFNEEEIVESEDIHNEDKEEIVGSEDLHDEDKEENS